MQQVEVQSEPREKFVLRVENNRKGNHFIKQLKKHLNKNTYDVRIRYSGKRPKGTPQASTRKENATSMRVYISENTDIRDQNLERYLDLLTAYRDLAKLV